MKRAASIQILYDGEHVRIIKSGQNRDLSIAVENAAMTDPAFRACVIVACIGMFEKKRPDLAVQILTALDVEPPTEHGRQAQIDIAKKLIAA